MRLPGLPMGGEGGAERWLITYADMITLLLVLFIILYSSANLDLQKFKALAESLREGFGATARGAAAGQQKGSEQGASPVFSTSGGGVSPIQMFPENQTPIQIMEFAEMLEGTGEGGGLKAEIERMVAEMVKQAGAEVAGLGAAVEVTYNERGIVITIYPDQILFDSGSARLKPGFMAILDVLAPKLKALPNSIEVDGHTDSVPISTATYPSNWELSAGRAGAVIRYLESRGLPSARLSASGYADTRPVGSNDTRQGRARNRRVELIVLRQAGEKLPGVPASALPGGPPAGAAPGPASASQAGAPTGGVP